MKEEITIVNVVYNGILDPYESRVYSDIQCAEKYMIQKIKDWLGDNLTEHDENTILEDGYFKDGGFYITINDAQPI